MLPGAGRGSQEGLLPPPLLSQGNQLRHQWATTSLPRAADLCPKHFKVLVRKEAPRKVAAVH